MTGKDRKTLTRIDAPAARAILAILLGLLLFGFTGWLAGKRRFVLDWGAFQQQDALVFLGAYAQLVLAAAVFFQIRTADRALTRQADAHEHELKAARADALVTLVATAANSRSLYVHAIPALRNVIYNHGQQDALDRAAAELIEPEQRRQDAHAARFRVEMMFHGSEDVIAAARRLTGALDTQRQRARAVLAWSRASEGARQTPDPQDVGVFVDEPQNALMAAASSLVSASDIAG